MFRLPVRDVRFFTPDIFELSLACADYAFVAGQCAVLLDDNGDSRPYSISSSPEEPVLRFLIRRFSAGAVSNWLAERSVGDTVQVSLPFGGFRPSECNKSAVFIATGVGIAPFLSVLRSSSFAGRNVHCFYGVRVLEDAVPVPTLRNRVNLRLAVSREKTEDHFYGRVSGLLETVDLPDDADYFICGYDAMIDEVFDLLRARGIPARRLHSEVFFNTERK